MLLVWFHCMHCWSVQCSSGAIGPDFTSVLQPSVQRSDRGATMMQLSFPLRICVPQSSSTKHYSFLFMFHKALQSQHYFVCLNRVMILISVLFDVPPGSIPKCFIRIKTCLLVTQPCLYKKNLATYLFCQELLYLLHIFHSRLNFHPFPLMVSCVMSAAWGFLSCKSSKQSGI